MISQLLCLICKHIFQTVGLLTQCSHPTSEKGHGGFGNEWLIGSTIGVCNGDNLQVLSIAEPSSLVDMLEMGVNEGNSFFKFGRSLSRVTPSGACAVILCESSICYVSSLSTPVLLSPRSFAATASRQPSSSMPEETI
jgi:hypothetical protein